jgi:hypothetical protein
MREENKWLAFLEKETEPKPTKVEKINRIMNPKQRRAVDGK